MEIDEMVPVLCMCRLCLNYSEDCNEVQTQTDIYDKIRKYLNIEIKSNDELPTKVCQQCIERIEVFDKFCNEVEHHQRLLLLSKLKNANHETQIITAASTNLIQLSPAIVSKNNGTLIITLQATASSANLLNAKASFEMNNEECLVSEHAASINYDVIDDDELALENEHIDSTTAQHIINDNCEPSKAIEQELHELTVDDITADIRNESDNEDQCMEDDNNPDDKKSANGDDITIDKSKFKDFPTKLIEGSQLLYKGRDLLEMISKFYTLECDVCKEKSEVHQFVSLSDLCQHYVDTHQIKGYVVCCNQKLIKPKAMALHMARHIQPDAFKCPECNKMLTCPKILQYHIQNHLPESQRPLVCSQCPRRFSYSSALVAHVISHQPENERAAHICDECGKVFVSAGRLTTHINVSHMQHGQDHTCNICGKKFACRSNLTYHLTTHQPKVRQVQCTKCDKWLKNKLCLRKHMVQHSSIRYSCDVCDYSALNKQCLRNHMRVQHTNNKPFTCDVCGKAFKLKNTLRNHTVQHTGVKRFTCPFCNRSFASSGNFYSHRKRMHPEELATMLLKKEAEERLLREQTTDKSKNS